MDLVQTKLFIHNRGSVYINYDTPLVKMDLVAATGLAILNAKSEANMAIFAFALVALKLDGWLWKRKSQLFYNPATPKQHPPKYPPTIPTPATPNKHTHHCASFHSHLFSPENVEIGVILAICDYEIWCMTLKKNRTDLTLSVSLHIPSCRQIPYCKDVLGTVSRQWETIRIPSSHMNPQSLAMGLLPDT